MMNLVLNIFLSLNIYNWIRTSEKHCKNTEKMCVCGVCTPHACMYIYMILVPSFYLGFEIIFTNKGNLKVYTLWKSTLTLPCCAFKGQKVSMVNFSFIHTYFLTFIECTLYVTKLKLCCLG